MGARQPSSGSRGKRILPQGLRAAGRARDRCLEVTVTRAIRSLISSRTSPIPPAPSGVDASAWLAIFKAGHHLTDADTHLVSLLLQLREDAKALRALVSTEGHIVDGSRGLRVPHPALRPIRDTEAAMIAVMSSLLLTPSSRSRAALAAPSPGVSKVEHYRSLMGARSTSADPQPNSESDSIDFTVTKAESASRLPLPPRPRISRKVESPPTANE